MLNELYRCWNILRAFLGSLVVAFAIAAACAVMGVALVVIGKQLAIEPVRLLGEATIIAGVCWSAWRVIAAELSALLTLHDQEH